MNIKHLITTKTFWLGIGTIAGAIVAFTQGAVDTKELVQGIIAGMTMIFVREGIHKSGNGGLTDE